MKQLILPIALLFLSNCIMLPALGQQATASGNVYSKTLPEDLPQSKILFVRFMPAPVPAERPADMSPTKYKLLQQHAINYPRANEQLESAAAHYPFAYRITTLDSTSYYSAHGYKYVFFHQSFNAFTNGTFKGTTGSTATTNYLDASNANAAADNFVALYIQDLSSRDRYIIDNFNESSIYNYKLLGNMLLKRVEKQFKAKK
jgi:hypothetical protein